MVTDPAGFFGPDATLYKEGEMIYFAGEPSVGLQPLNKPAREKKKEYLQRLDEMGRAAAEKLGKAYTGYGNATETAIELERLNAKQVQVIGAQVQKTPMSNPAQNKGKVQVITATEETPMTAEAPKHNGKLSLNNKPKELGGNGA